jgi:ribonuclease III family protein
MECQFLSPSVQYPGHYRRLFAFFSCLSWISVVRPYASTSPIFHLTRERSSCIGRLSSSQNADSFNEASFAFLRPPEICNVDQMSATDLAYIGDVVYELYIRSRTVWPPKRTADVHQQAVALVRGKNQKHFLHEGRLHSLLVNELFPPPIILYTAEHQSQLLQKLRLDGAFILTSKEEQILTRGRNAASQRNHNRRDPGIYQEATALEALVGYLYINDPTGRCAELFDWIEAAHVEFNV